jgi:hypothetical protein
MMPERDYLFNSGCGLPRQARRDIHVNGRELAAPGRPSVLGLPSAAAGRHGGGRSVAPWFEPPSEGGAAMTDDRSSGIAGYLSRPVPTSRIALRVRRKRGGDLGLAAFAVLLAYSVATCAAAASEAAAPRLAPSGSLLPTDRMAA